MNQQESEDSNLIPLLLELAVAYVRANPSQASRDEFRHKLIDSGVAHDLVSRILDEPTNLLKQPDPQPSTEVSEQSPSLLLYFALCAFAVFLIVLGLHIQAANWSGLILNLATEIIGAVLILVIVDKRLRRDELQALQKYAESSSTRLSSMFIPDVRDAVYYAKALSFELRRIQPKAYFVRKEYENLFERYSRYILLFGVAGCGKSTLLQSIALKQIERVKRQPQSQLPIILPMRQWSSGEITNQLWQAFHGFSKANQKKFCKWLHQGRFIVMFDGLDESQEPKLMLMEIKEFKDRYPNIPILASCRSGFLTDANSMLKFQPVELSNLSNAEAAEFIRRLMENQ